MTARGFPQEPLEAGYRGYDEPVYGDAEDWDTESSPLSELVDLSFVCPLAVYFIQLAVPAIFSDLLPGSGRNDVELLTVAVLGLSYLPPLLTRFVFLKRPVKSFAAILLLFPVTLFFGDLCFSMILRSFSLFSRSRFEYVPVFYLAGWSLFILLYAHCTILKMSFYIKKRIPLFRRIAAYTVTLALSVAMSVLLCMAFNNQPDPTGQPDKKSPPFAASASSLPEDDRQTLPDVGAQDHGIYFRR
jgi:hypothetical protein